MELKDNTVQFVTNADEVIEWDIFHLLWSYAVKNSLDGADQTDEGVMGYYMQFIGAMDVTHIIVDPLAILDDLGGTDMPSLAIEGMYVGDITYNLIREYGVIIKLGGLLGGKAAPYCHLKRVRLGIGVLSFSHNDQIGVVFNQLEKLDIRDTHINELQVVGDVGRDLEVRLPMNLNFARLHNSATIVNFDEVMSENPNIFIKMVGDEVDTPPMEMSEDELLPF